MSFHLFSLFYYLVVCLFAMGRVSPLKLFGKSYTAFDADCGMMSSTGRVSRIVGGVETEPNEFPWQAFLQVEMQSGNAYVCGGTLIADRWILTAARCVQVPGYLIHFFKFKI